MPDKYLRIAVSDIQRLSFECAACGSVLSIAPPRWASDSIDRCPDCRDVWGMGLTGRTHRTSAIDVLLGLKHLVDNPGGPFILRLEVPAHE